MRVDVKAPEHKKLRHDKIIKQLSGASHKQIDNWVDENIKSVADVKRVLKWLLKINIRFLNKVDTQ